MKAKALLTGLAVLAAAMTVNAESATQASKNSLNGASASVSGTMDNLGKAVSAIPQSSQQKDLAGVASSSANQTNAVSLPSADFTRERLNASGQATLNVEGRFRNKEIKELKKSALGLEGTSQVASASGNITKEASSRAGEAVWSATKKVGKYLKNVGKGSLAEASASVDASSDGAVGVKDVVVGKKKGNSGSYSSDVVSESGASTKGSVSQSAEGITNLAKALASKKDYLNDEEAAAVAAYFNAAFEAKMAGTADANEKFVNYVEVVHVALGFDELDMNLVNAAAISLDM